MRRAVAALLRSVVQVNNDRCTVMTADETPGIGCRIDEPQALVPIAEQGGFPDL
ncbi:hypothetical protein ACFZAV_44665 [Streptomyces sp. NPDC008343]|uniref:hypothetical protein n=1 Tax=Streptomyces sp. NPDC008343 TaxID=3364828 RepID=UPI0036E40E49